MASGSYGIGLTATPNLYSNIYASKMARADADRAKKDQEAAEKYAKDADKFRIDYSKIHPYHAKEAKLAGAEFISGAGELQKQYPHTWTNTDEYNNLLFKTTARLEDLTNSSKNIYGDFQRRADKPQDFETRPEILDAINKNDHATVMKLMGKDYFDAGDITQPRFKIEEHAELLNKGLKRNKVYDEKSKRNVGGASNDYIIPYQEAYDDKEFLDATATAFAFDPVAQQKFKTVDEYRNVVKPMIKLERGEEVKSLQSIPTSGIGTKWNGNIGTSNTGTYIFNPNGVSRSGEVDVKTETALKQGYDKALSANKAAIKYAEDNGLKSEAKLPSFDVYKKTIADKLPKTNNPTVVLQYKGATDNPIRGFVGKNGESINGSPKFFEFVDNEWVLNVDEKNPLTDKLETKKIPLLDDKGVNLDNIQADYGELDLGKFDVKGEREVVKTNPYPKSQKSEATYTIKGKTYKLSELEGMGYTETQVSQYKD